MPTKKKNSQKEVEEEDLVSETVVKETVTVTEEESQPPITEAPPVKEEPKNTTDMIKIKSSSLMKCQIYYNTPDGLEIKHLNPQETIEVPDTPEVREALQKFVKSSTIKIL